MKFQPITDEEADSGGFELIPPGTYKAIVAEAVEKTSAAGNDMINVMLEVLVDGQRRKVWDYLVAGPKTAWKVRHFAKSAGIIERYETGELNAADCVGHTVEVEIKTQKSDQYPDKSVVKDYVGETAAAPPRPAARMPAVGGGPHVAVKNDEIPFTWAPFGCRLLL